METLLLSANDAGKLLGCSGRTVVRLADSGKLPRPIKVGHLTRWRRAEIAAWVDGGGSVPYSLANDGPRR